MSEPRRIETERVNNFRVTEAQSFRWTRPLCWHGKRRLRVLLFSNGAEIYCNGCGLKKYGYSYDPNETITISGGES